MHSYRLPTYKPSVQSAFRRTSHEYNNKENFVALAGVGSRIQLNAYLQY